MRTKVLKRRSMLLSRAEYEQRIEALFTIARMSATPELIAINECRTVELIPGEGPLPYGSVAVSRDAPDAWAKDENGRLYTVQSSVHVVVGARAKRPIVFELCLRNNRVSRSESSYGQHVATRYAPMSSWDCGRLQGPIERAVEEIVPEPILNAHRALFAHVATMFGSHGSAVLQ